jgi:hypothetical protein
MQKTPVLAQEIFVNMEDLDLKGAAGKILSNEARLHT